MVNTALLERLKSQLEAEAKRLGFAAFSVASAVDDALRGARLREWIEAGHHGSMGWMEDRAAVRQGPQSMWPEAKSVIALGMSYAPEHDPLALERVGDRGRISVYAQGRDYHDTVKKAAKALARFMVAEAAALGLGGVQLKVFTDTAPVMEKPLGEAAGIGWQGKHSNLVSQGYLSRLIGIDTLLSAILTTLL